MRWPKYIFLTLSLVIIDIWISIFQLSSNLKIIACDVGQGDAILVIYKQIEILTDGGPPNGKINSCLSKYMPFYDRNIEVVINTHAQLDHYGGLIDVFKSYDVGYFVANKVNISSPEYEALRKAVGGSGAQVVEPVSGKTIRLGLIYLDILNPDREMLGEINDNKIDLNNFSVVYRLSFGSFSGLFTGDLPPVVSDKLVEDGKVEHIDYIKIPHHGSRNGLTENLLEAAMPKFGVISVGKNNIYRLPNSEVLDMLSKYKVETHRTDLEGDVIYPVVFNP